jgi:hypothetical protein
MFRAKRAKASGFYTPLIQRFDEPSAELDSATKEIPGMSDQLSK